jgi:Na+/proline symporter
MPLVASAVLPPLLGALLLAAIAAAIMSTASALMLVAGSALARDLYGTVRPGATDKERLLVARLGIVVVGSAPLVLIGTGVGRGELVQFIVLLYTSLMASSFFVPVVVGVYWSRATKEGTLAAMTGGMLTCLLWKAFGSGDIDPVLPGLLVSALLFVAVSLWTTPPPDSAFAPYRPRQTSASG